MILFVLVCLMSGTCCRTDIEWFPGECLTKKIVECNPNKRLITAKPMIRTVDCQSFFKQPPVPKLRLHSITIKCTNISSEVITKPNGFFDRSQNSRICKQIMKIMKLGL